MIEPRERSEDYQEAIRTALDGRQKSIWTALPGIVDTFDPDTITATVQPAINMLVRDVKTNEISEQQLPIIPDVPVCLPRGGGYTLTFPVKKGDECILIFQSRNMDNWWQEGGTQRPWDRRMHDISDAMAVPGPFSQRERIGQTNGNGERKLWHADNVQLRSNDGERFLEIDGNQLRIVVKDTTIRVHNDGTVEITAPKEMLVRTKRMQVDAEDEVIVNTRLAHVRASNSATVETNTALVRASNSVTMDTPVTHCTGHLAVDGNFIARGQFGGGSVATIHGDVQVVAGSMGVDGSIAAGANITTPADVRAGGVGLRTHVHGGVQSGGANTGTGLG